MKIGMLGTGEVGRTLGGKLVQLGHDVMMGGRSATDKKVLGFAADTGGKSGSFADAAGHGELIIHATRGETAIEVLKQAGAANLAGKPLVDLSNALDFSKGYPPSLLFPGTDSLGEMIQREFPDAFVVKALNTVTASIMIEPKKLPGVHSVFVCGDHKPAKGKVMDLLRSLGWQSIVDLGDIKGARATEQMLPLWERLYEVLGTGEFNFAVVKRGE